MRRAKEWRASSAVTLRHGAIQTKTEPRADRHIFGGGFSSKAGGPHFAALSGQGGSRRSGLIEMVGGICSFPAAGHSDAADQVEKRQLSLALQRTCWVVQWAPFDEPASFASEAKDRVRPPRFRFAWCSRARVAACHYDQRTVSIPGSR